MPLLEAQQSISTGTSTVARDAQAVILIQNSITAMGTTPPTDSTANGTVNIVAGSLKSTGTVQLLTRGTTQTNISFQTNDSSWSFIYSNGQANRIDATGTTNLSMERSASTQSLYFPLPFLSGLFNNPDVSLQFVAQEAFGTAQANHIRAQNTFNSFPASQFLTAFTVVDIWFDPTTSLPVQISMVRRDGGGAYPRILMTVCYSNYQQNGGLQYPYTIQEFVNGTLWITTSIQSVAFSTGLTEANFPLVAGSN